MEQNEKSALLQSGGEVRSKSKPQLPKLERQDRWIQRTTNLPEQNPPARNSHGMPGASTGDPTHEKVMRKRPDWHGRSGLEGLPGPARASTPKPKSVCLLFTVLCFSPTLLTLAGGYFQPPFCEENQLRALTDMSPHWRSVDK